MAYSPVPKKIGQTHTFTNLYVKNFPAGHFDDETMLVRIVYFN
jgi:hypothetical protein